MLFVRVRSERICKRWLTAKHDALENSFAARASCSANERMGIRTCHLFFRVKLKIHVWVVRTNRHTHTHTHMHKKQRKKGGLQHIPTRATALRFRFLSFVSSRTLSSKRGKRDAPVTYLHAHTWTCTFKHSIVLSNTKWASWQYCAMNKKRPKIKTACVRWLFLNATGKEGAFTDDTTNIDKYTVWMFM